MKWTKWLDNNKLISYQCAASISLPSWLWIVVYIVGIASLVKYDLDGHWNFGSMLLKLGLSTVYIGTMPVKKAIIIVGKYQLNFYIIQIFAVVQLPKTNTSTWRIPCFTCKLQLRITSTIHLKKIKTKMKVAYITGHTFSMTESDLYIIIHNSPITK